MRKFKNKKTGKITVLDERFDKYLIKQLDSSPDYKELVNI